MAMFSPEKCRDRATECLQWAESAPSSRVRDILLDVARTWTRLAIESGEWGQTNRPKRGLEVLLREMHQGSQRRRPHFCLAVRGEIRISGADPALSGKPIPPLALSTRRNSPFADTRLQPPLTSGGIFAPLARTRA